MHRRRFLLAVAASALTRSPRVDAQAGSRARRIGVLSQSPPTSTSVYWEAFARTLAEQRFREGAEVVYERRSAQGRVDALPRLADELVHAGCDVIVVTAGDAAIRAVRAATSTIPVVMAPGGDPVRDGFVASLFHPGGNVTGIADITRNLIAKRLELLVTAVPAARRVAFVLAAGFGAGNATSEAAWTQDQDAAARALGVELIRFAMRRPEDFDDAMASVVRSRPDAVMLSPSPLNFLLRDKLAEFAVREKWPTIAARREEAAAGSMMSYGASQLAIFRAAARYVAKILGGARPDALPVEKATPEFVVNLRTARQIGVAVPRSLVLRADELIQ